MQTFVQDIVDILKSKHLTLSSCESVTGGMLGSNIVGIPGASKIYWGGLITYSNQSKINLAKVDKTILDKYGAISKETALAMAEGTKIKFNTDIVIATTGDAGPTSNEHKPIGLAYVTIIIIDKAYTYELHSQETNRNSIRIDFAYQALTKLWELLKLLK